MAAKERHKQKVKQRLHDRLEAISLQEESLHSLIKDYVQQARSKAEDLLATDDTAYFMNHYGGVEVLLDRVNNTCELLSTTAEDMIEASELDMTVKPDMSMLSLNETFQITPSTERLTGHIEETPQTRPVVHKTSNPGKDEDLAIRNTDTRSKSQEETKEIAASHTTEQNTLTQGDHKTEQAIKDGNIKMELQAMLEATKKKKEVYKDQHKHVPQTNHPHEQTDIKDDQTHETSEKANHETNICNLVTVDKTLVDKNKTKTKVSPRKSPKKKSKASKSAMKQSPSDSLHLLSKERSGSPNGSRSRNVCAIIPSPVKKMMATYIGKEESKEMTDPQTDTADTPSHTVTATSNIGTWTDAAHSVTDTSSHTEQNVTTASNTSTWTESSIHPEKKTSPTSNSMKSAENPVSDPSVDSSTGVRANIPHTEPHVLPLKTSSKASTYTYTSVSASIACDTHSEQSEGVTAKDPSSKTCHPKESNVDHHASDISHKDVAGASREVMLNDLEIKQSSLPCGKVTQVIVSDIYSPWCFCVQSNPSEVNLLMEKICTYMSHVGLQEEPLSTPKKGQMCLAKFSKDTAFYRAYIMSCFEASKEVEVLYVDYGNRERVKISHLRRLPQQFYNLPMQAICCSLAEVMPSNKYMLWTEEDIMVFKHCVLNQQLNCIQACKCSTAGVPLVVRLISNFPYPTGTRTHMYMNQISIGAVLVERGSAKFVSTVNQISYLEKSGEGKEESLILNEYTNGGNLVEIHGHEHVASKSECPSSENTPGKQSDNYVNETKEIAIKLNEDLTGKKDKGDGEHAVLRGDNPDGITRKGGHSKGSDNSSSPFSDTVRSGDGPAICDATKGDNCPSYASAKVSLERGHDLRSRLHAETVVKATDDNKVDKKTSGTDGGKEADQMWDKQAVADSETMSSTGTNDLESERSTDTGFQSSEVTFDLKMNPLGEEVMLAHVQSPTLFYVHVLQVGHTMDRLMKSLNRHFEKMNRRKLTRLSQTFIPAVDKLCCAQLIQDNNFYRAIILKIRSDSSHSTMGVGKVHVRYIDFGDEDWLPKRRLFPLPPQYSSVPPLAIKCKLAYIKPVSVDTNPDVTKGNYEWSTSSTKAFVDLMSFEKTLHMQVVEGHLSSGCKGELVGGNDEALGVYLVDTTGTEEVCANMDLISQGHAILDVPKSGNLNELNTPDEIGSWNPMEEDYLSKRNTYQVDIEDAEMATVGYKSGTRKGVCRYFSKGAHCWSGENCPYRHVQTDSAVPLEREEVYCTDNQWEALPEVNSWVAAEVITILTPGHFYILLPMGNKSLDGTSNASTQDENANPACTETLDDLLLALNTEYSKKSPHDRTLELKAPGEIVVARFSQDKQWYRARVIQVTEDKVKVFFLDFGNTEWLPDEEIAEITPEFLHLPFQAFECFLCNVEPAGEENWSQDARFAFRDLVDGKTLVAHIRSRSWNGCLSVDLYDTSEEVDVNVGEKMIEQNHALRSSFLTDSSCNASVSGQSQPSNSDQSEVIFLPG